jgi:hypothetical protein
MHTQRDSSGESAKLYPVKSVSVTPALRALMTFVWAVCPLHDDLVMMSSWGIPRDPHVVKRLPEDSPYRHFRSQNARISPRHVPAAVRCDLNQHRNV